MVMKQNSFESPGANVFTLLLKTSDQAKLNFNFLQYGLKMSSKGPHNFMFKHLAIVWSGLLINYVIYLDWASYHIWGPH